MAKRVHTAGAKASVNGKTEGGRSGLLVATSDVAAKRDAQTARKNLAIDALLADPMYDVHRDGTILVYRPSRGKWKVASLTSGTYSTVFRQGIKYLVHRVIYRKFHGPLVKGLEINHIDGNKGNNSAENLEQVSHSSNIVHSYSVLGNSGPRGPRGLHDELVKPVRAAWDAGMSNRDICRAFEVPNRQWVSLVVKNVVSPDLSWTPKRRTRFRRKSPVDAAPNKYARKTTT